MAKNVKKKISYERKKQYAGYLFIALWLFGFTFLTLIPLCQSFAYSLSDAQVQDGGIHLTFVGLANYKRAFFEDAEFFSTLVETLGSVLMETPLIIIFSLFIAVILNNEFRGRTLARAIFFLPVIIAGGVAMDIINSDTMFNMMMSGNRSNGGIIEANFISEYMAELGVSSDIIAYIVGIVNNIFNLTWKSGIQILIFIAALQSVSTSLYEVSKVEGATAWETFWKVTFPMIMPMMLVNVIYTIIDNYINYSNAVFKMIRTYSERIKFDYAAAMSWINFIIIFIVIIIVYLIINKRIFYMND